MKNIKLMCRSIKDYILYVCGEKKLRAALCVIELGLFFLSVGTIIAAGFALAVQKTDSAFLFALLGVLASAIEYLISLRNSREYVNYEIEPCLGSSIFEKIRMCREVAGEPGGYRQVIFTVNDSNGMHSYILMSDSFNRILWNEAFPIRLIRNTYKEQRVKTLIRTNWDVLFPFLSHNFILSLKNGRFFFNETKLCVGDGFLFTDGSGALEANCKKGSYYDSFLTNGVYGKRLQKTKDELKSKSADDAFTGYNVFPENDELESFQDSILNHEIGVSTIAMTKDHHIFLLIQSKRAMSSNMLVAPSGSGSCDYDDIQDDDFRKTLCYAMQRELWEETGFQCARKKKQETVKNFGETRLIGFFRWVEKCGKPEFIGITQMNCAMNDLKSMNTSEVMNVPVLDGVIHSVTDLRQYLDRVEAETIFSGRTAPKTHRGISIPTLACIHVLKTMCSDPDRTRELSLFWNIENI